MSHFLVNKWGLRRQSLVAAALGATLSLLVAYTLASTEPPHTCPAPDPEVQRIMRAACRLPDKVGEFVWFHYRRTGLECGQYQ